METAQKPKEIALFLLDYLIKAYYTINMLRRIIQFIKTR